jgi:hypothetical protein
MAPEIAHLGPAFPVAPNVTEALGSARPGLTVELFHKGEFGEARRCETGGVLPS